MANESGRLVPLANGGARNAVVIQQQLDEAWARYRADGNDADRNYIATAYLNYAYAQAWRWGSSIDWDERRSAVHIILLKAIPAFVKTDSPSFEYFLARRIPFDLRDHFFRNADCPDRSLRKSVRFEPLHSGICERRRFTAFDSACLKEAMASVPLDDQQLVCATILGHERITDIAKKRGWGYTKTLYQRQAALLAMKTGGHWRISWTELVPGRAIERTCRNV